MEATKAIASKPQDNGLGALKMLYTVEIYNLFS